MVSHSFFWLHLVSHSFSHGSPNFSHGYS
jgi:hypothetical protein